MDTSFQKGSKRKKIESTILFSHFHSTLTSFHCWKCLKDKGEIQFILWKYTLAAVTLVHKRSSYLDSIAVRRFYFARSW